MRGLEGIGSHDKQAIQCSFEADSVDLKIRDFKGKHWRFYQKPLSYHIVPASSNIQVKSNSITITLKKEERNHWVNLTKNGTGAKIGGDKKSSSELDEGASG